MERWIGHFHVQVNARTEDDVDRDDIIKRMTKALGAAYEAGGVCSKPPFFLFFPPPSSPSHLHPPTRLFKEIRRGQWLGGVGTKKILNTRRSQTHLPNFGLIIPLLRLLLQGTRRIRPLKTSRFVQCDLFLCFVSPGVLVVLLFYLFVSG